MRIYLACTGPDAIEVAVKAHLEEGCEPAVLLSYFYAQKLNITEILASHPGIKIFADSGAFSAFNMNRTIDAVEYGRWLVNWLPCFTEYSNLDVKMDYRASLENQRVLESMGLSPIPVFHGGEPWWMLRQMAEHYPHIALGGIAGASTSVSSPPFVRWISTAFKIAEKCRVHGFGMTNYRVLKTAPWFSVDSSTWSIGTRFGRLPVFDRITGKGWQVNLNLPTAVLRCAPLLRSFGLNPIKIIKGEYGRDDIALAGARAQIRMVMVSDGRQR